MNIFTDFNFKKIKDAINVNFLPNDFVASFKKRSYYRLNVNDSILVIGTENSFEFLTEYNCNAFLFKKKAFKIGEINQYDLVYIYSGNIVNLYIAKRSRGYSEYEMTLVSEQLDEIIDNPEVMLKYINLKIFDYFNESDFQSLMNYLKNADLPDEFYELFGKQSHFSKSICGNVFHFGAFSMNDLFFKNVLNSTIPGYTLTVAEDEGEVNILYLFSTDGMFKGVYGIHDDNLGDFDELVYLAPSLRAFMNGAGHENYLNII